MHDRKFLWQPDPFKAKDYDATQLLRTVKAVPREVLLDHLILDILDQEDLGSCVANAGAQAIRAAHVRAGFTMPKLLSRLFAYYFARATHSDTQQDTGTWIRAFFDVVRTLGFCPEKIWPYDVSTFKSFPSAEASRRAADQIATIGYHKITSTGADRVRDIQAAIAAQHCVIFGTQVSNKFAEFKHGSEPLDVPGATEQILGGHALTIAGYTTLSTGEVVFHIVNSWSRAYGSNGWCTFKGNYLGNDISSDFWIVDVLPHYSDV